MQQQDHNRFARIRQVLDTGAQTTAPLRTP
jgi:hypothetical protein